MRRSTILAGVSAIAIASVSESDTRLTLEERTQMTIPGNESDTTSETTLWLRSDRAARVDSSGRIITRLDRGEAYVVNDAERTYTVIKMDTGSASTTPPRELEASGEIRTFGTWTAKRYEMTFEVQPGETAHAVFWMSTDVDIDADAYRAFTEGTADAVGMSWIKAVLSVEGYPVLQETTMDIVKATTKLVSVSEENPPADIYEPPSDYTRK